jgi:hypothetical protein
MQGLVVIHQLFVVPKVQGIPGKKSNGTRRAVVTMGRARTNYL